MLSKGLFAAACIWIFVALYWCWDAVSKIDSNLHIRPVARTAAIAGDHSLTWEFTAHHEKIARLWLIIHKKGDQKRPVDYQVELRSAHENKPLKAEQVKLKEKNFAQRRFPLDFTEIQFEKGERYILQISAPQVDERNSIEFSLSKDIDSYSGRIIDGDQMHDATGINSLFLAEKISIPKALMIAGGLLLLAMLWISATKPRMVYAVAAIGCLAAVILSIWHWEDRCWEYPFNFWPDGYARYAFEIKQSLLGEQDWKDTCAFLAEARNGQVFFVPLLVGAVSALGLSLKLSFALVNILFSFGTVALAGAWLRQVLKKDYLLIGLGLLALVGNISFIRVAAALQTDVASLFLVTLFGWSCHRYLTAGSNKQKTVWSVVIAVSLICGLLTRIALAPLIVVPLCLSIYESIIQSSPSKRTVWLMNLPVIAAAGLLSIIWYSMGLWGSFLDAYEFSGLYAFRSEYSVQNFIHITVVVFPLLLLALPGFLFKGLQDRQLVLCFGIIAGLLLFLYAGKIIPWVRYWAPASGIVTLFVLITFGRWIKNHKWLAALFAGAVVTQIMFYLSNRDLLSA